MFGEPIIQTNKLAVPHLSTSILISILFLVGLIRWPHNNKPRLGRPYVYSPTVILRCFIVRIWFRLDSNRALHEYLAMDLSYNKKVMKVCGLSRIPNRRTFDRRLATISNDIKNRVTTMGELFVPDKIIDPSVLSTDSTLIKAKGHLWHKSSMKKKVVHVRVSILMQDGDSVIQRVGYFNTNSVW